MRRAGKKGTGYFSLERRLRGVLALVGKVACPLFLACAPPPPELQGCTAADWVDRSAPSADRRVGFGTQLGSSAVGYAPRCLRIAPGQTVTFVGNFGAHPLAPTSTPNPIPAKDSGGDDLPVTFPGAGGYPYHCTLHAPTMVGAVWVVE